MDDALAANKRPNEWRTMVELLFEDACVGAKGMQAQNSQTFSHGMTRQAESLQLAGFGCLSRRHGAFGLDHLCAWHTCTHIRTIVLSTPNHKVPPNAS